MAQPKRRLSRTRRDLRRSHLAIGSVKASTCSHCKQPKMAHRVCPNCGYYAGVEVIQPKE
jgi:large subunit ribosomal protein L32